MIKNHIIYTLLIFLSVTACTSTWDDHYHDIETDSQSSTGNSIWEYIKNKDEYSLFTAMATATGTDEILAIDQQMTLWIPNNNAMTQLDEMSQEEKTTFVKNHINYIALYTNKLSDDKQVNTLAGKKLIVNGTRQAWQIDNINVINPNQVCSNGVVHEINGLLIPRKNIFEYLSEVDDNFSIVRDTILGSCIKQFRPDLSFPKGVDEVGNTIYDSIFVYESALLSRGDIREENSDFTMFLPDNDKVTAVFDEVSTYYPNITANDSVTIYNWIFKALIYRGKIDNYTERTTIQSTHNLEWRTDIQQINPDTKKELSNGYVYEIDYFRVPHYLFLSTVTTYPTYRQELSIQNPELVQEYFTVVNFDAGHAEGHRWNWEIDNGRYYNVRNDNLATDKIMSLEFISIDKNRYGDVVAVPVVPGNYRISGQFRSYNTGNLRLTVNGILPKDASGSDISFFNTSNSIYDKKEGLIGYITIPETAGVNPVTIKFETGTPISGSSFSKRISVSHLVFEPDGANY